MKQFICILSLISILGIYGCTPPSPPQTQPSTKTLISVHLDMTINDAESPAQSQNEEWIGYIVICAVVILLSFIIIFIVSLFIRVWYLKHKKEIYFVCKLIVGSLLIFASLAALFFLYGKNPAELFNGSTLWVLALLFVIGLVFLFIDIRRLHLFKAAGVEIELSEAKKEAKAAYAEAYNNQGNLNKFQKHYAKAIWDYAHAAKLYAEKGDWINMFGMLNTITKYTELEKGFSCMLCVFSGRNSNFGYDKKCEPRPTRSPKENETVIKNYHDSIAHIDNARAKLKSIMWSDDVEKYLPTLCIGEINGRLNYTIKNLKELIEAVKTK